jgi:hypothetical protein
LNDFEQIRKNIDHATKDLKGRGLHIDENQNLYELLEFLWDLMEYVEEIDK